MLDILFANLPGAFVVLGVVIPIRQPEPSLIDLRDGLAGIVEVGARVETEERTHALGLQPGDFRRQARHVRDRVDLREFGGERRRAGRFRRRLVHTAGVEIADLLVDRVALLRRGGRLENLLEQSAGCARLTSVNRPQREYSGGMGLAAIQPPQAY